MGIEIHDGLDLWKTRLFDPNVVLRAGGYYGSWGSNAYGIGANYLVAQYWPLHRGATFDRIGIGVQTAEAGAGIRLGIYADDDLDGYPDRLVLDAGVADLGSTGLKTVTIEQHLSAGLYFLALLGNSGSALLWMEDVPKYWSPLGTGAEPGLPTFAWRAACTYGPLPDPFPAGAAGMNDIWGVCLRAKSAD